MAKIEKTLIFLMLILALASFFRLWQLDSIPPGLFPDVAMYGNDALESLRTGNFKVFYPDNFGREGLFMWLLALSFSIFGVSIWSLKIVVATIGILTVLGLYLLTKELLIKMGENISRPVALLTSFFLAISFWHVNFSRLGFRAILFPFILVFAFYFLFRGFRTQRIWHFIVSGIFFGLGFYTYISYRFIVLLLPIILLCWFFIYQKPAFAKVSAGRQNLQKIFILNTFYLLLTTFIVALPIGIHFLQNPQDFVGRAAPVSVFAAENPIKEFGKSLILHLGMFNFYGDPNWRHNFAGSPQLFWPVGILFLIGIIFSIKEFILSIKTKNYSLFTVHCLLLSWFSIMLLPGILTYEGIPHALRTIGVIPVVYIFSGLGGWWFYQKFRGIFKFKKLFLPLCLLFLVLISFSEFHKYFFNWAKRSEVKDAFTKRYADIGYYLNSLAPEIQKYVIVNEPGRPLYGISISAQTPKFIEATKYGKPRATYLAFENLDKIKIEQEKIIIIPMYNGRTFEELFKKFPEGETKIKNGVQFYEID